MGNKRLRNLSAIHGISNRPSEVHIQVDSEPEMRELAALSSQVARLQEGLSVAMEGIGRLERVVDEKFNDVRKVVGDIPSTDLSPVLQAVSDIKPADLSGVLDAVNRPQANYDDRLRQIERKLSALEQPREFEVDIDRKGGFGKITGAKIRQI